LLEIREWDALFATGAVRLAGMGELGPRGVADRLAVAPGVSALQAAMLNAVIIGTLAAVLAVWALGTDRDIGGWFTTAY
jgi:SPW repeat-containing protein